MPDLWLGVAHRRTAAHTSSGRRKCSQTTYIYSIYNIQTLSVYIIYKIWSRVCFYYAKSISFIIYIYIYIYAIWPTTLPTNLARERLCPWLGDSSDSKTYQAGLHACHGRVEGPGRRGAQSKMHLVAVGRRVTALNFVAFLVALSDVLRTRVVPLAMRAQAVSGASWEMDGMCQRTLRHLGADLQVLRVLRRGPRSFRSSPESPLQ